MTAMVTPAPREILWDLGMLRYSMCHCSSLVTVMCVERSMMRAEKNIASRVNLLIMDLANRRTGIHAPGGASEVIIGSTPVLEFHTLSESL